MTKNTARTGTKREDADLKKEVEELRGKVCELEETLDAIRSGEVDAIVVSKGGTRQVYTIDGADHPYRALVENIREGALTISRTGMILYTNSRFAEMVQLSPDKVPGTSILDHVGLEYRPQIEKALSEIVKKACRINVRIQQGRGSLPVLISMNSLSSKDDTKISVVITDRRKDEDRIRLQARMIDAVGDAVIAVDTDHKIIFWNEAATRTYGWSREEVIGHKDAEVVACGRSEKDTREILAQLNKGEIWRGQYLVRHQDGHEFPIHVTYSPVFDDNWNLIAIIGASHDISEQIWTEVELQKSAERTRAQLDEIEAVYSSTPIGLCQLGTDTRYIRVNQKFTEMDGFSIGEHVGRTIRDLDPDLADLAEETIRKVIETGKPVLDVRIQREDLAQSGVMRYWQLNWWPFKDGHGQVVAIHIVADDITDRKRAEEKLIASLEEKEVLLREIHHRVKNNLQLISGLLDMTLMRSLDKSTNSILTDIMLKIQTMAQIHTRLYESKQFGSISLTAQIRDQVTAVSDVYCPKGQKIRCEINPHEVFLPVDQAIPCSLVINEILSNAYKHAFVRRKHGTIEISALQDNDRIRITVRDDGIGLPAHFDISRINSLGLKLIRTLVQYQLKGSLLINSDHGTEIIVEFPMSIEGV